MSYCISPWYKRFKYVSRNYMYIWWYNRTKCYWKQHERVSVCMYEYICYFLICFSFDRIHLIWWLLFCKRTNHRISISHPFMFKWTHDFNSFKSNLCCHLQLSLCMTKPTKWHVRSGPRTQCFFMRTVKTDGTGRMPRLIWDFAGRTIHFVGFVVLWLSYCDELCTCTCLYRLREPFFA